MTELRSGVDLVEVGRVRKAIERSGERFLKRVFTARELALFESQIPSLAARWAAKEAVAKAFCTGIGDVSFQEIEILQGDRKEPALYLHGAARALAREMGLEAWSISLSHAGEYAIAFVVAWGEG